MSQRPFANLLGASKQALRGNRKMPDAPSSWSGRQIIKNISEKVGKFLACEIDHKTGRIHHAIHHNFTTKTPPLRTASSKTTLKNTGKSRSIASGSPTQYFF
jgi:hypothetical protein